MSKILIVILALMVSGCYKVTNTTVDEEFLSYLDRFEHLIGVYPYDVSVLLVDQLKPGQDAVCKHGRRLVYIKNSAWLQLTDNGREQLVYHELGHCFLELGHNSSLLPDGCPASIMNPYTFGNSDCYAQHRDRLLASFKKDGGI